jgi:spastin
LKKNNLKYQEGINLYNEGNYEDSLDYLTHAKKSFGDLNKLIQEDKNSYPKEFRNDLASKINEKIKKIDESIKKCSKKLKEKASKNNTNQNNNSNNYNYSFNPMNSVNNNANNNMNYNNQNKQKNLHDKEEDEMDQKVESEIMVKNPNVKFSDIIGMNDMKQTLYEIIIVPQIRPDFFTGIRKPQRGILLFGPPGTGKTMIAKAIASECKSTFFNISASSLTSKWVGESEKTVKSLFKVAYKKVPSIIFIDEIDSILSKRSENENEATKRLKTEFLIQFDGLGSNTNAKLLVIAATNRPMDLDEALLRRLPKRVYCGPLDEDGRFEFIKKVINRVETNLSDDDIREIAKKTNDYSNSDLMELCREAAYQPVRELTTDEILKIKKFRPLVKKDLLTAVQKIRGTLSKKVRDELKKWNDQFGGI